MDLFKRQDKSQSSLFCRVNLHGRIHVYERSLDDRQIATLRAAVDVVRVTMEHAPLLGPWLQIGASEHERLSDAVAGEPGGGEH